MPVTYDEVPFEISVVGDTSGDKWFGKFSAIRRLPHRLQMMRSRIRREMLGAFPEKASQRDIEQAVMLSELAVSITKAPKWWLETDSGQEMIDDNVIIELYNKIQSIRDDDQKEEDAKTKADAAALKKAVENPDPVQPEEKDEE